MSNVISVDLGGTNLRVGVVSKDGKILDIIKESTDSTSLETILRQMYKLIDHFIHEDVMGIGVDVAGACSSDGLVYELPNLGISETFNLKNILEERYHLPVMVGNDANVACLAEACIGSGKGYKTVQFVTLSTGIGGGLVIDNKVITGKIGFAQEIGSMIVNPNGHGSPCKPRGCVEGEASGTALLIKIKERGLKINNLGDFFALKGKDATVNNLIDEFTSYLAILFANIINYIEPDIIVLGGGLLKSSDYFLEDAISKTDNLISKYMKGQVPIVKGIYNQDAATIGAAMQIYLNVNSN